jgi:kinetochore protein NDC80
MRKSMGGAILQHGGDAAGLTPHHPNRAPSPARNRRVSLAPTMTSTSSSSSSSSGGATATSGGGTVPGSSSNIDPRDIKDRSYLQTAIRKMVTYLTSRGYADASSLNVKQLVTNGPSGRDFQNIMTFLFRRVDPTFNSTSATTSNNNQRSDEVVIKFEDEVSMSYRCLGYPFPISKTGLVAVGSPHTWPALIAAIDWLVDVLTIRDEEEVHDWGPDDITAADSRGVMTLDASLELIDSQFHHFLRKSIGAFLKENDEECAELEGVLLDTFQKDHLRVEENLTALDNECELMKEEIASLSAEVDGYVIYICCIFSD